MSDQFLGEIRAFAFNFPPKYWALCNGQLLPVSQNQALFSLLGVTYGGNGQTTFGLPDLQGRAILSPGQGPGLSSRNLGEVGGEQAHTLTVLEMPQHNHLGRALAGPATLIGGSTPGSGKVLAQGTTATSPQQTVNLYSADTPNVAMAANAIAAAGSGQSHENRQPYLALNYCIALVGIFPSRN